MMAIKSKALVRIILILLCVIVIASVAKYREIFRLYKVVSLFNESNIVYNFQNMTEFFPYYSVSKGEANFQFIDSPQQLPQIISYDGEQYRTQELLNSTATMGFIVIKNDQIIFEDYRLGSNIDTLNISWSVNKSFVSALIGIAINEGLIKSVNDPVTDYAPLLKGTGYDRVPLKHVLQMSSGVVFDEDYAAFFSDINRMGRVIALGSSINKFAASLESGQTSGQYHQYVSMDTQVLGMVLKQATGVTPSQYLQEKLWSKMGMRSDARWLKDDDGMELAFGTLNVTLRDYARFGLLYAKQGNWLGEQLVPKQWVKDSVTPDAEHLQPGDNSKSSSRLGYGYQWWIPENPQGDFLARGVYGQYIYVNPKKSVVIVKTSANPKWRAGDKKNLIMVKMFQDIANQI